MSSEATLWVTSGVNGKYELVKTMSRESSTETKQNVIDNTIEKLFNTNYRTQFFPILVILLI